MDFINNRTRSILHMSLDGLYERSKAIAANTANALTPGYKRKEVSFEESLQGVIKRENEKEEMKLQNAIEYQKNPSEIMKGQSLERLAFLNTDINKNFFIDTQEDSSQGYEIDGNNVNIETEMMDEAKNGMQYATVASLLSKSYQQMQNIITGQNQ
ncbi:MAG: flagellar basal body rod protein FlgB [Candidatus Gastranaerophilales bacterium]|nr:flagellar basal body rod protein FlgB [Candidatus Gastranaerophilales bacterium]